MGTQVAENNDTIPYIPFEDSSNIEKKFLMIVGEDRGARVEIISSTF